MYCIYIILYIIEELLFCVIILKKERNCKYCTHNIKYDILEICVIYSGASHSALGDMRTIMQETSSRTITASEPRPRDIDVERDPFINLDEFYVVFSTPYSSNTNNKSRNEEVIVIAEPEPPKRVVPLSKPNNSKNDVKTMVEGEAQKKFGSAKAISSDQYFQDSKDDDSVSCRYILIFSLYIASFYFNYNFMPL